MAIDERQQQLDAWIEEQIGQAVSGVSASSDASFRRYFRYELAGRTLIAMDAPPATEDCRPFVRVAHLLSTAGVSVPEIISQDIDRGFLLLSDLGRDTYLDVMSNEQFTLEDADALFVDAIAALVSLQKIPATDQLANYDQALLRRELELFPEWYMGRHLGIDIDSSLRGLLDALFDQLIDWALAQNTVFVHRDYMPRNLMVSEPNPGVLDFQDAVCGPVSYDPICLFKDAFISWPEEKVQQWLHQYWVLATKSDLPVPESFEQFQFDCDVMGVQRHLKVIGIFARICHRDGKPRYLNDVPRFFNYLKTVADRRPELNLLSELLALVKKEF